MKTYTEEGLVRTTLCYVERDGCWLMLYRVKKKQDLNQGKWIGIGGHVEPGETPEECVRREAREETGLVLTHLLYRGVIDFLNDCCESEVMYLYTADRFAGDIPTEPDGSLRQVCDEGVLAWVPVPEVMKLSLWEGDRIFLRYLTEGRPFFHLRLHYHGDSLQKAEEI